MIKPVIPFVCLPLNILNSGARERSDKRWRNWTHQSYPSRRNPTDELDRLLVDPNVNPHLVPIAILRQYNDRCISRCYDWATLAGLIWEAVQIHVPRHHTIVWNRCHGWCGCDRRGWSTGWGSRWRCRCGWSSCRRCRCGWGSRRRCGWSRRRRWDGGCGWRRRRCKESRHASFHTHHPPATKKEG